jgi:aldehyde:ferredoxin oxidoreductase
MNKVVSTFAAFGGWTGKIARVDLASGQVAIASSLDMAQDYVGGRGFAARLYWDGVQPEIDALNPENLLMFMAGPLGGTHAIACSRLVVSGKSPLLFPDQYGHATMGGSACAALKSAGFDGMVLSGRASTPVCLYVADGAVRIDDAGSLWGLDTQATLEKLQAAYGEESEALCIGPAGESLVRFALIMTRGGSCAGHGFGALMGSKHIKAIVFQGSGTVQAARPEQLKDINRRIRGLIKGRHLMDPLIHGIELVRRAPCRGCPAGCPRGIYKHVSGAVEHRKNCASVYFYYDWDKKYHGGEASDQTFLATSLCDRAGVCTQELTKIMDWLYACMQQGLIREEELGLPFNEIGSKAFFESFLQQLVQRRGFGDVLAEGVMRAARIIGRGAEQLLENTLSDTGFSAGLYNGRYFITTAIFHATDPTNPMAQLHEVCYPLFKWVLWQVTDGGMSAVDTEAFQAIARRFWGGEAAVDFSTYEGKAKAAVMIQNRTYAKETLVACDFFYPIVTPEGAPDHVGDPALESELLSAVTGIDFDEQTYYRVGERVFNLTRAIHSREGRRGRQHDRLPEFNFTEPLASDKSNYFFLFNPECMLPGKQGELVSRKGAVLEKDKFDAMLSEFYRLRGWDERTGLQTEQCLQELNLEFLVKYLNKKGYLI